MKLQEFVNAFTANLSHEISDLGGSAATARATISTLLANFKNDFASQIDGLDKAIADVLDGHADKANRLAEAARNGEIIRTVQPQEVGSLDVPDEEATIAIARKLARRAA
jgi:hypothetical protein